MGTDTLFQHKELVTPGKIQKHDSLSLIVPRQFTSRRLYLFLDTKFAGDFALYSAVVTKNRGTPVDFFRADLFDNTNGTLAPNQSLISCFAAGGSAVGDSIVLQLLNPFNVNVPTVVVQPFRVDSEIDEVEWVVESFAGQITGIRAWLGCISSKS